MKKHITPYILSTALCTVLALGAINISSAYAAGSFINVKPHTTPVVRGTKVTIHGCNDASSTTQCKESKTSGGKAWAAVCKMSNDLGLWSQNPTVGLATSYDPDKGDWSGGKNPKVKDCCDNFGPTSGENGQPSHTDPKSPLPAKCKGPKKKKSTAVDIGGSGGDYFEHFSAD